MELRLKEIVPLDEITVGERFRKDYKNVESLAESMREKGLLDPILLDAEYNLADGGRRLEAAQMLNWTTIRAFVTDNVDEVDRRELELIKNVEREDFNWIEKVRLVAEIHRLNSAKYSNWSGRKTADRVNRSVGAVSQQLKLAEYLEDIPELEACSSEHEARKTLDRIEEEMILAELAKRKDATSAENQDLIKRAQAFIDAGDNERISTPDGLEITLPTIDPMELMASRYIIVDCFDYMRGLTNGFLGTGAVVEIDPPYGIDLKNISKGQAQTLETYNEIPSEEYPEFLIHLLSETYRIMGDNSTLIMWYGIQWHSHLLRALKQAGFSYDKIPCMWYKPKNSGQTNQPNMYLGRAWESFIVGRKGDVPVGKPGRLNVFEYDAPPSIHRIHPTERPVDLLVDIIQSISVLKPEAKCFIPFLGSGNTLRACDRLGIDAVGCDLSESYRNKFLARLEEVIK